MFLLNLREGKGLSQTAVNTVVSGCQDIFTHCLELLQTKIHENNQHSNVLPDMDEVFADLEKPFDLLKTGYMQEKFYREELNITVSIVGHAVCVCAWYLLILHV